MAKRKPKAPETAPPPQVRPSEALLRYDFFTVEEVAVYLRCNPWTVRRLIKRGTLAHTRVGKKIRISRNQLDAFTGMQGPRTPPGPQPGP